MPPELFSVITSFSLPSDWQTQFSWNPHPSSLLPNTIACWDKALCTINFLDKYSFRWQPSDALKVQNSPYTWQCTEHRVFSMCCLMSNSPHTEDEQTWYCGSCSTEKQAKIHEGQVNGWVQIQSWVFEPKTSPYVKDGSHVLIFKDCHMLIIWAKPNNLALTFF